MLVDLDRLEQAYFAGQPDPMDPAQRASFATSGHRQRGAWIRGIGATTPLFWVQPFRPIQGAAGAMEGWIETSLSGRSVRECLGHGTYVASMERIGAKPAFAQTANEDLRLLRLILDFSDETGDGTIDALGDLIIAAAEELDQAETMAERIGQNHDPAPDFGADRAFGPCAGSQCPLYRGVKVINHHIEVH